MLNRRSLLLGVAAAAVVAASGNAEAVVSVNGEPVTDGRTYQDFLLDYDKGVIARVSRWWQAQFTETDRPSHFLMNGEGWNGVKLRGKLSEFEPYVWFTGREGEVSERYVRIIPPTDFDLWLLRLDWHFENESTEFEGSYVEQTGRECWLDSYNDGLTPREAFLMEVSYWVPE